MDDVPKLPDEHLEKAKEIISRHRTKKNCQRCYNRGYQGINQLNMAITCYKCVDEDQVTQEWLAYVRDTPALAQAYGDYFEPEEEPDEDDDDSAAKRRATPEPVRRVGHEQGTRRGGPQHHRSVGR